MRGVEQSCNRIEIVLSFLQSLLDDGLGYSAINTARSALSVMLERIDNQTVGNHPLCVRFLGAVSRLKPPTAKYSVLWDPSCVLTVFNNEGNNDKLTLKMLSIKLACLWMLCTGQRVQTLSLIKTANIKFNTEGALIFVPDVQPVLQLKYFKENSKLCVVCTLQEYLNRTSSIQFVYQSLGQFQ